MASLHHRRSRPIVPALLFGALATLGACSSSAEPDAAPTTSTTVPVAADAAADGTDAPADGTPEAAWSTLSQDERNSQCTAHLDSPDQIWESLSSDGASEDEITAYQAMLDTECSESR